MSETFAPTMPVATPPVEIGDDVLIYRGLHHAEGALASVESVCPYALVVRQMGIVYHGVRYRHDPILESRKDLITDAGGIVWDECPRMKRLRELEGIVQKLAVDVEVLKSHESDR